MWVGIGNTIMRCGGFQWSDFWATLISATIEDADATKVILTFSNANTDLIASDFSIVGKTISSLTRDGTNKVLTLTLSTPVEYGNVLTVVLNKGVILSTIVTNNITYITALNNAFGAASVISHFPTAEVSGNDLVDTKNSYNGSLQTPDYRQASINGLYALGFGATDYANFYNPATHLNIDEGTILIWVKTTKAIWANNTNRNIFNLNNNGTILFKLYVGASNNTLYFYTIRGGITKYISEVVYSDGYILLAVTWSVTNNRIRGYLNGNPFIYASEAIGFAHDTTAFHVSQCGLASAYGVLDSEGFKGLYSNITLLNKECTEVELKNLYNFPQIIFDGDSRSNLKRWDAEAINSNLISRRHAGLSGQGTASMITRGTTYVDAYYKVDTVNTVVVWIGVNDSAQTPQYIYDNIKTYCLARKAAGFKVLVCTEIDAQHAGSGNWHSTIYLALNVLLRADYSFADGLADLGANVNLQDATNLTYFNADKIHLTDAGYSVVAGIVLTGLQSIGSIT
jgi:hypothetical protein